MRLHSGFQPQGDGAARVVDWISVPLGVATLKDRSRMSRTMPRALR
jgi:exopolyphosphatase/guanosine-5'-triphosphate,3'-diphosphate pyrophosphatase